VGTPSELIERHIVHLTTLLHGHENLLLEQWHATHRGR
jgi:hypothetical protein